MDSLKGKVELVGILAVVLSLLLVAYEIRQSTFTAAAQAVFELNESGRASLFLKATDPEMAGQSIEGEPFSVSVVLRFYVDLKAALTTDRTRELWQSVCQVYPR